ncbi:MAG: hypothetical protein A2Y39_04260 [Candidatus Delongbacteria bacterium GWF2_40_14]|nr:MAG: hypothetical protein A2Y39_04260 [Candidatus Delongbacteria bacterium GWF2_40_14]
MKGIENSDKPLLFKDVSGFKNKYFSFMDNTDNELEIIQSKLAALGKETLELSIKLKDSEKEKISVTKELAAVVESEKKGTFDFTIKYYMRDCQWKAHYNAYFNTETSDALVEYMATVNQSTGENWDNIKITVSEDIPFLKDAVVDKNINQNLYSVSKFGKIKGRITDEKSYPVSGANIFLENTDLSTITDNNGYFSFFPVNDGNYKIRCEYTGYASRKTDNIKVSGGKSSSADLAIYPIDLEKILLQAEKNMKSGVAKDLTTSARSVDMGNTKTLAVTEVEDVLRGTAGIMTDSEGEMHFRGGRAGDVNYQIDGISVGDPTGAKSDPVEINFSNVNPNERYSAKPKQKTAAVSGYTSSSVKYSSQNSVFDLPGNYSIKSGEEIKVNIIKDDFLSKSSLIAIPNISNRLYSSEVYVNNTGLSFPQGQFNIFLDDSYVGQLNQNNINPGDSLSVSFGESRSVKMKRFVRETKSVSNNLLSEDIKTTRILIETEFTNVDDRTRTIFLKDPLPYSDYKDIKIELLEPEKWNTSVKYFVSAKFDLKKGEKKKFVLEYEIKYPKTMNDIVF